MRSDRLLSSSECLLPLLAVMSIVRLVLLVRWSLGWGEVRPRIIREISAVPQCSLLLISWLIQETGDSIAKGGTGIFVLRP